MPECEICGRETAKLYEVSVEGAVMLACEKCSRGKNVLREFSEERTERRDGARTAREPAAEAGERELVDNYGEVIRKAREALGLPLRVLAEKINEKESVLARVENQTLPPEDKVIRKLERELGIKLTAVSERTRSVPGTGRSEPLSLWDAAEKKR